MESNESQIEVRINHQIEILNIVRKGRITITELALYLDLSFTATSKIVDELVQEGFLVYSKKNKTGKRGRKPAFVEINNNLGVFCVIDYASRDVRVVLSTLDSQIIVEDFIPDFGVLTTSILLQTEEIIKKLLERPEVNKRPLLSICIISPGIIRADDFSYVISRILQKGDTNKLNPALFFSNAFNVKVEMHNDVRIGCYGEMKYCAFPKERFNGMFIHLGSSAGLALVIDGKIYSGSNNSSGEVAHFPDETDDPILAGSYWNGKFFPLVEIFARICQLNNQSKSSVPFDVQKIVDDFQNNDPNTVLAVEESAKRNAITIDALATILDVEYIIIEGQLLRLGNRYIDLLRKYISIYALNEIKSRILISTLKEDCEVLGACYKAVNIYLLDQLEAVAKKRTKSLRFTLDKKYREL